MAQLKSTSVTGNLSVTGNAVASSFIKRDGLANQFLMADGHVENAQGFNQDLILNAKDIRGVNQLQLQSANFNGSSYDHIYVGNTNDLIKYRTINQFRADLKLAQVYDYKGTLNTLSDLKAITSAKVGDTYFIATLGESWSCKKEVTAATNNNYTTYWSNLGNTVDLTGYTTLNTNQTISGAKIFSSPINIRSGSSSSTYLQLAGNISDEYKGRIMVYPPYDTRLYPLIDLSVYRSGYNYRSLRLEGPSSDRTIDQALYLCTMTSSDDTSANRQFKSYKILGEHNFENHLDTTNLNANLTLEKDSTSVSISLLRKQSAQKLSSWTIINEDGFLRFKNNWNTDSQNSNNEYKTLINIHHTTGNINFKGNLLPSGDNENRLIGDTASIWNKIYVTQLISQGLSSSWYNGRDKAVISLTIAGAEQYRPILSTKTTSGSWEIGSFRNSDFDNRLLFNYVTDKDYDAKTNKATHAMHLTHEGNIILSGTTISFSNANFKYNNSDKCIDVIFN